MTTTKKYTPVLEQFPKNLAYLDLRLRWLMLLFQTIKTFFNWNVQADKSS